MTWELAASHARIIQGELWVDFPSAVGGALEEFGREWVAVRKAGAVQAGYVGSDALVERDLGRLRGARWFFERDPGAWEGQIAADGCNAILASSAYHKEMQFGKRILTSGRTTLSIRLPQSLTF